VGKTYHDLTARQHEHEDDEIDRIIADDCRRNRQTFWALWWAHVGISERHKDVMRTPMDTRDGQLTEIINYCLAFSSDTEQSASIYLHGNVGSGKTLLAAKMLLRATMMAISSWAENEWRWSPHVPAIRLRSVPALLTEIRGTFGGSGSATSIINEYSNLAWLALDDIGAEKPSEWVCDVLFQIVDERYGRRRPTIFTSNLSLRELSERLGERIADRVMEMCGRNILEIKVGSYRDKSGGAPEEE